MENTIAERVERIRAERVTRGLKIRTLAKLAEITGSTIQGMDEPDWNPTLKTLVALEKALFQEAA